MKMRDVMRSQPWTARESDPLGAAQRMMAKLGVRHLPVTSEGKLTGILSDRDVLQFRATVEPDEEWWKSPVRDAMHAAPQTAGPDDSLTEVAARLAVAKIGAMPIVERGKLLGLVTVTDVLGAEVQAAMDAPPPSLLTAADVMTGAPTAITPDVSLLEAAHLLAMHGVRHLPVVDEGGAVIGIVSDRDIRDHAGDPAEVVRAWRTDPGAAVRAGDAMTPAPATVREDTPIMQLALELADRKIGALPVVSEAGTLIGIVSYIDVLRALAR